VQFVSSIQEMKANVDLPGYSDASSDSEGDGNPKRQRRNEDEVTSITNNDRSTTEKQASGRNGTKERKKPSKPSSPKQAAENSSKPVKKQHANDSDSDVEWGFNANDICFEKPIGQKQNLAIKNNIFEIRDSKIDGSDWTKLSRNGQTSSPSQLYWPSFFGRDILNAVKIINAKSEKWMKKVVDCKGDLEKVKLPIFQTYI
jgi:hypothetical protein